MKWSELSVGDVVALSKTTDRYGGVGGSAHGRVKAIVLCEPWRLGRNLSGWEIWKQTPYRVVFEPAERGQGVAVAIERQARSHDFFSVPIEPKWWAPGVVPLGLIECPWAAIEEARRVQWEAVAARQAESAAKRAAR